MFCDAFYGLQHLGAIPVPLGLAGHAGSESWCAVLRDRVERMRPRRDRDRRRERGRARRRRCPSCARSASTARAATRSPPGPGQPGRVHPAVVGHDRRTRRGSSSRRPRCSRTCAASGEQWDLTESDSGLSWLPLFHDMGLIGTVINALYTGGTLHQWPTESFLRSPGRWVELLGELRRDDRDRAAVRARARRAGGGGAAAARPTSRRCATCSSAPRRSARR